MEKNEYQAELFKNRLQKKFKHLSKWAKRENIFAYRLYDKDIPEVPVSADIYYTENDKIPYVVLSLYKRPYEKDYEEEALWLSCIREKIKEVINVTDKNIISKIRKKQKGKAQYQKLDTKQKKLIVKEGSGLFYVNLEDYLDTGLFLDHRSARINIFKTAENKKVLNLFSYTGAFSVHALLGKAQSVTSVDLSNTYLNWAKENFVLNNIYNPEQNELIKSDVIEFLEKSIIEKQKWDIVICDPPTFSNSKSASLFDVNKDWLKLNLLCLQVLKEQGILFFSSNSLRLKFDSDMLIKIYHNMFREGIDIKDVTKQSIPEDFRNKKIHKMWKIYKSGKDKI